MAIYRYTASADNTITNAFRSNLVGRGTGSNMGAADILEAFYIVGQTSGSSGLSSEKSRILINFPFDGIESDRSASVPTIPESGSVSWYLKLYNARHASTLPKKFHIVVQPISASWQEGSGLDMDEYTDQTYDRIDGSNWIMSSLGTQWTEEGGDFIDEPQNKYVKSQYFEDGTESLEINVTEMVERFLHGSGSGLARYGFGIKLSGSFETGSQSYYTKKFFSRSSEFFFKRPVLEARWDSSKKDDAGNFYLSSALAPAEDNINTLYLYNYIKGQLKDIPTLDFKDTIFVSLYSGSALNVTPTGDPIKLAIGGGITADGHQTASVGGKYETGIYTASVVFPAVSSSITTVFPVWNSGSQGAIQYHTGSAIEVYSFNASNSNPSPEYVNKITNLKQVYSRSENATFRLYVREKGWSPTIYTVANAEIENKIIENAYYKVFRIVDDLEVIPYGTGSASSPQSDGSDESYTRMSYDKEGNYFNLNIDLLESGYAYGIKLAYYKNGSYQEQSEIFKFKVED
tara:strand:+ start:10939 stop:12489 length:1551 start_codon:yes stop_codon:yes gene_type:complete